MSKITQQQLLEKSFWNTFAPALRQGGEAIKSIGKLVAPELADPIKKGFEGFRDFRQRLGDAGMSMEKRIIRWAQEQGKWPLSQPKMTGKYPDGTIHYVMKIAEKGVNKNTGQEGPGRLYREPVTIVAFDPKKKEFNWRVKPRWDGYLKKDGVTQYGSEDFRSDNDGDPEYYLNDQDRPKNPPTNPKKVP